MPDAPMQPAAPNPMNERMFFVIGAPRSGTTLLMRMLHAHPDIYTRPEPHLLTPLAYLGYYQHVAKAPFDPFQSHLSVRQFVDDLPRGEDDYLDALRAYTDTMYGRMLAETGKRYFLDKTPAYALETPFIKRVYPNAQYVVITRHPFAIFSSFAKSFFDNDWEAAHAFNPIIERYVPAIADFVRKHAEQGGCVHVRYEDLVTHPEEACKRICAYADMEYTEAMIAYGEKNLETKGLGDPIGVAKDNKPNTKSIEKWALEVHDNPKRLALLQNMVTLLSDQDLETWGYTRTSLWDALDGVDPKKARAVQRKARAWNRYAVERRLLLVLRRNIHQNWFGRVVRKVRFVADILLRNT